MKREALKRRYAAPALEKAFEIFELLAGRPGGATISEMTTILGRSAGELFRIVIVMEQHGYLLKSPVTDRYTLAYKMLDLAFRATPAQDLVEAAMPVMTALTNDIGQSCHLVVVNDTQGLVIARRENPGVRGFALRVGAVIDLLNSCSGNVIMAFSPDEERTRIVTATGAVRDRPVTMQDLESHLTVVRERGYDTRRSPVAFGVTDISFPLFGFDGGLMGALTIPFMEYLDGSQKVALDAATQRLANSARRISGALGWREGAGPTLPDPDRRRGARPYAKSIV